MRTDRWERIEELFDEAAEIPPPKRSAFLEEAVDGDEEIRREVESLLAADEAAADFLEKPAAPAHVGKLLEHPEVQTGDRLTQSHVGPYRLLRELGEGGMSRVYLAVRDDDQFKKLVAIKVIRDGPHSSELNSRFRTERQILASLDHANIARILDGGSTEDGLPYFLMDYIEGAPLDEYCDRTQLTTTQRLELFLPICEAVDYAHRNLVVHRDLKPSNILVTSDGIPKLLDFGIAKLLKPEQFSLPLDVTTPDLRPLTPYYASPEQLQAAQITTASDVYSLGVLLFKLLTGRFPYRFGESSIKEVERVVFDVEPDAPSVAIDRIEGAADGNDSTPPETIAASRKTPLARLRKELAGDLDNILLTALRKEPDRRYASVRMFSDDLQRHLDGEPVLARGDQFLYRVSRFLRRNRVATAVAAAFLALLIGFSVVVSLQARQAAAERDQAQLERDRAEQVVRFLQGIFQLSNPDQAGGETITAREILDQGAARVAQELTDQPIVRATLMEAIGNVYRNLGLYDSAEVLLRRTLATREQTVGIDSLAAAQTLNNLGIVLRSKGEFEGAGPLFRRALELRIGALGDNHPDVAQSLYNLGTLEREVGNFDEAEQLYRLAIGILRQSRRTRSELSASLGELAILRDKVGDTEGAVLLFREALDIRREIFPPEHTLVAEAANNLAVPLAVSGDLDAAAPLFREAYDVRRKLLGDEHPTVTESLNNVARLHQELGEYERAEELYRRGIEARSRTGGRNHPTVATLISNLAVTLQRKGDLAAAESAHREALEIRRNVHGSIHPDIAISLKNLGAVLLEQNDPESAQTPLRQGVLVFETALPPGHWRTAEARSFLGHCLAKLGRFEEAEPLLVHGLEDLRAGLGPEHRRTQAAHDRLTELQQVPGE